MARLARTLMVLFLAGCGNALEIPEDIPITHLPANQEFILTLIMKTCSDTCAKYDEPECSVEVDEKNRIIHVDARVPFEPDAVENCISVCGGQILAHCEIEALPPGRYTVMSKGFVHDIVLE